MASLTDSEKIRACIFIAHEKVQTLICGERGGKHAWRNGYRHKEMDKTSRVRILDDAIGKEAWIILFTPPVMSKILRF